MSKRPKLPLVDPEMRRWCAQIEDELTRWPDVTTRPMFGLTGYYRGGTIFAAIPRTRAVETPFSLLVKSNVADARLKAGGGPGRDWCTFELQSADDIKLALEQLARAYDIARRKPRRHTR